MKIKFILNSLLLSVLIAFSCIFITIYLLRNETDYYAALIDKHQILEKTPSPKIIFIGGSSVAFGIDSHRIKKSTGMNVVNMGLQAGLGLKYIIDEIRNNISEGDIVIVSPEYEHFGDDLFYGDEQYLFYALIGYPDIYKYLHMSQYLTILKSFIKTFSITFRGYIDMLYMKYALHIPLKKGIYCRGEFNQFGDMVGHLSKPSPQGFFIKITPFSFSPSGKKVAEYLNSFHTEVIQKKAKIYYIFPSIPDSAYQQFKKNFIDFNKWLNKNITIPIIGSPEQFTLPESFFFDTHYHLNKKGVESRTQTIIDKIKTMTQRDRLCYRP